MKKLTTEEFVNRAILKYGAKFDYSDSIYTTAKRKIKIFCNTHNLYFEQGARDHLMGIGCPACIYEVRTFNRKKTTVEFINKAKILHQNKYLYSKTNYKGSRSKLIITCPIHGDFKQLATNHLSGYGCSKCANVKNSNYSRSSTSDFISKAKSIHGDTFDYSKVNYTTAISPVIITCKLHGEFTQVPNYHLCGNGCSKCSSNGYNPNIPGSLYVLTCNSITKIGITNRKIEDRCLEISRSYGEQFYIKYRYFHTDGNLIKNLETYALSKFRNICKQPDTKFDGYTECFLEIDPNEIIGDIVYRIYELTEE